MIIHGGKIVNLILWFQYASSSMFTSLLEHPVFYPDSSTFFMKIWNQHMFASIYSRYYLGNELFFFIFHHSRHCNGFSIQIAWNRIIKKDIIIKGSTVTKKNGWRCDQLNFSLFVMVNQNHKNVILTVFIIYLFIFFLKNRV